MSFSQNKIINALPAVLEPNSFYHVRSGTGYRTYLTTSGGVAIPQNTNGVFEYNKRWNLHDGDVWVGPSTTRGFGEVTLNTTYGSGAAPDVRWNMIGPLMRPGMRLTRFMFSGTVNNSQVEGIDWFMRYQYGDFAGTWDSVGETTAQIVSFGTVATPGTDQFTTPEHTLDYVVPAQGYLGLFMRATGTLTQDRLARIAIRIEYESDPNILT